MEAYFSKAIQLLEQVWATKIIPGLADKGYEEHLKIPN
jgi:hypothetical protein